LENQIKILGLIYVLIGGFGALAALILFGFFGGAVPGPESFPLFGFVANAIMLVMLILAVPMVVIGVGLLRFRAWARWGGTVLSVFSLLHFPLGTTAGIYALSLLTSQDIDPLFNPRFASVPVPKR